MGEMNNNDKEINISLASLIETLLFVAPFPVSVPQLSQKLKKKSKEIKVALRELEDYYREERGLRLQWHESKVQITTSPELSSLIEDFLGLEIKMTLSQAALEVLSIVVFKQPITRPSIDEIRGVNSDSVLRTLLNKGLIQEKGRSESVGRPILYGTTSEFLQYFGLSSLAELPSFGIIQNHKNKNHANRVLKS